MVKEPIPGRVKTRLCPPCTDDEAAQIGAAAIADTLAAARSCGADRVVVALDGRPGDWLEPGVQVVPQVAGGLDRRLTAAWAWAGGPGLQIGMDTPQVTPGLLDGTLAALMDGPEPPDAVLGPAADGGWWAIGLHRDHPQAFLGVPMSTSSTAAAQHERLRSLGLRTRDLERLRDIDRFADALEVARGAPHLGTATAVSGVASRLADDEAAR